MCNPFGPRDVSDDDKVESFTFLGIAASRNNLGSSPRAPDQCPAWRSREGRKLPDRVPVGDGARLLPLGDDLEHGDGLGRNPPPRRGRQSRKWKEGASGITRYL